MRSVYATILAVTALGVSLPAGAAPTVVPYLGYLVYDGGAPVNAVFDVQVRVYDAAVAGQVVWGPHTFSAVPVIDGLLNLPLGGGGSPDLAPALDGPGELWLAFDIGGVPLSPRQQVLSVPFARRAELATNATQLIGQPGAAFALLAELPPAALSGSFDDLVDVPPDLATASGTAGAIPRFSGARSLTNSILVEAGGKVGVNEGAPQSTLHVGGGLTLGMEEAPCTALLGGTLRWTGSAIELCDGSAWVAMGAADSGGEPPGPGECGTFTDSRDGKTYSAVLIGPQCWMAQNLDHGTQIDSAIMQQNNGFAEKYCYANDPANCALYGGLYQWDEAVGYLDTSNEVPSGRPGICPPGWHVPSDAEWKVLEASLGMSTSEIEDSGIRGTAGGALKSTSSLWASPNTAATNVTGFNALPAGDCLDGFCSNLGSSTHLTLATSQKTFGYADNSQRIFRRLTAIDAGIFRPANNTGCCSHRRAYSVRCLRTD